MIEILTPLVWTQLWQVTLLFGGILLLSRTCLRRHPHGVHALWLVGLIKCLIPPLWSSHLGVFSWCQLKLEDAEILSSHAFGAVSSDWIRTQIRPSVAACLLAVWLAGVAFSAALVVMRWRSLRLAIRCSSAAVPVSIGRSMQRLADQLRVRNVLIYVTAEPVGPAVLGVFRKALILPQNLIDGLAESELEPILAHELLHVRRQDTWASALQVVANCVWWFHPLVWWGARDSSSQCERSVDADVLRILNYSPSAYARCLVSVLEARCQVHPVLGSVSLSALQLTEERLRSVLQTECDSRIDRLWLRYAVAGVLAMLIWPGSALVLRAHTLVPVHEWDSPPPGHVCELPDWAM